MVRRLSYRLQRQGMLELDHWLVPLNQALEEGDSEVVNAIEDLMACEVPQLLAMQAGTQVIPKELKPLLDR